MRIYYFETSAINYLWRGVSDKSIVFLREVLTAEKEQFLALSPITMWEILCTPDDETRDGLIHVCQLLFGEAKHFPSPVKILDTFMERGCQLNISLNGLFDTECWISDAWRDVVNNEEKTITVEEAFPEKDKEDMKRVSRILRDLIKNKYALVEDHTDKLYNHACQLVNTMYDQVKFIQEDLLAGFVQESDTYLYKTAIYLATCILILCITPDHEERYEFWSKRGISDDIQEQLKYLFLQNETILHRGPLVYMASMALSQAEKETNRGLYKDCLHAAYMSYCTTFFTRDKHFLEMANDDTSGLWNRARNIEQFCEDIRAVVEKIQASEKTNS